MKLDVVIPTRNRPKQLHLLLQTLKAARTPTTTVWVFFDIPAEANDFRVSNNWFDPWLNVRILQREFAPPTFWNDFLHLMTADAMVYLSDHCTVDVNCIKEIEHAFDKHFPHFDGVIGLHKSDLPASHVQSAFGAIGRKYADRFRNREVWCPDYKVFYCDTELGEYADSIGRFHYERKAMVTYYFPYTKANQDNTWHWSRRNKPLDIQTNKERRTRGLLWGRDFELVR